jgi:YfiH family protein
MTLTAEYYTARIHDLSIYQVPDFRAYPGLTHAIFSRKGGVSVPPFESLNLSLSVGDRPAAVQENLERICRVVGINPQDTASCHLVHGADILTVTHQNKRPVMGYADGLITRESDIFLFMRFADCTPLIFFDPNQQAIGVSHAGWRGTMQDVAGATVRAMVSEFGCLTGDILAAIGPSIGPCCYEVGPEVINAASTVLDDPGTLLKRNGKDGHAHFDLWEANRRQLAAAGITSVIGMNLCTACHTDDFFSHRAENGKTGRFGMIIGLRGDT